MLFVIVSILLLVLFFMFLFVSLSIAWKKLVEKLLKHISEATTMQELSIWVAIYVLVSVAVFVVEVFIIVTVWEAIF